MRLKLLIADPDQRYLGALEQYFSVNQQERFYLGFFSKQEYLLDYLKKNPQEVDILLVNSGFYTEDLNHLGIKKIFLLSEGLVQVESSQLPLIKKFQSCDALISKIMDAFVEEEIHSGFSETNNQTVGKSEGCKIFSIYSPMGGVGKTTVAVATGTLLAQMGKKVLYLNLEGISSQYIYFQQGSEYSLSNIFYLTKNRNKNLTLKLESMVMKDYATQIHYIAPLDSPLELEEIEPKDIEYLLTELEGSRMYDYIILDLSSNFDSNNLKFMTMSHKVMMILNHDPIARTKGDQLLEQINRTPQVKDKLLDKIIWIMNCSMVDDGDDLVEEIQIDVEEKFIKFNLPESRESWVKRDGKLVLNSSSPLAKAVLDMLNTLEI